MQHLEENVHVAGNSQARERCRLECPQLTPLAHADRECGHEQAHEGQDGAEPVGGSPGAAQVQTADGADNQNAQRYQDPHGPVDGIANTHADSFVKGG